MLDYNMKKLLKYSLLLVSVTLLFTACKKEYLFGVDDVDVVQNSASKNNVKTTTEFVSIAYSDIYGSTIPQVYLTKLSLAYLAFGDKKLVEDIIIKNMYNIATSEPFLFLNVNEEVWYT